jgi:hypothetical protein
MAAPRGGRSCLRTACAQKVTLAVLEHRQSLVARPFSRLSPEALGEAQQRFEKLVAALQDLRSSLAF